MADVPVKLGGKTQVWVNANPNHLLLERQHLYILDGANAGKFAIGDGVTLLGALTFYGGSSSGLTIGTTTITSGTNTRILYNNNGVVGEYLVTGTGTTAVLSTSPTFTTDITTPLIIGGSAVGSTIQYKGTSGVGTSTVAAHQFLVGNNGATAAMSVYNSGHVKVNNALDIGNGTLSNIVSLRNGAPITGGVDAIMAYFDGQIQSGVTSTAGYFLTSLSTDASVFTLTTATHFQANQGVIGAGSAITNQNGFVAAASLSGATNNKGFVGMIVASANNWNTYNSGTAQNYFEGNVGVGLTVALAKLQSQATTEQLRLSYNASNYFSTTVSSTGTTTFGLTGTSPIFNFSNAVNIGNYASPQNQRLVTIGQDTSYTSIGSWTNVTSYSAIYMGVSTPGNSNHALISNGTNTQFNSTSTLQLAISATVQLTLSSLLLAYGEGVNKSFGTTTGTKFGTGATQKIGFWNATPIVQPSGATQAAPAAYATGAFGLDSNANMQALYDLVVAMRTALVNSGLMKGAA